jgi:hypothetical protein
MPSPQDPPKKREATPVPGMSLSPKKQIEFSLPVTPVISITIQAFSQLFGYAYATDIEVSLLGIVDRGGSVFTVREFFLVEQSGHRSHTETDPVAIAELIEKLIADGRSDDARKLRCWAHSHPGMDVFWSPTDDTNCRRLVSDWLVSIVVSDGFKIRCRIDVAAPVAFTLDHVPVFCESPVDAVTAEQCKTEVKEKIKHVPFFGAGKPKRKKENSDMQTSEPGVELMEYCDLCGGWHVDGECPMQLEESAYEIARHERVLEAEGDLWGDDKWY